MPEQIAILQDARSAGEVTIQHLYDASMLAKACFDDAGIWAKFEPADAQDPLAGLIYTVRIDDGTTEALADHCIVRNYDAVAFAYGVQPASVERGDRRLLDARPGIVACANAHGVEVSGDATADELRRALFLLRNGFELGETEALPASDFAPVDCAGPAGLSGY